MTGIGAGDNLPFIQVVAFNSSAVQISFAEHHDNEGPSTLEKTLTIAPEATDMDLFSEMMEAIHHWLDDALRVHRQGAPEPFKGRR